MAKKKNTELIRPVITYPLFPLDDMVVLPFIPQPVKIEDEKKKEFINMAFSSNTEIFVGWISENSDKISMETVMPVGTVCKVDRMLQIPGAPSLAFLMPVGRATLVDLSPSASAPYPLAKVVSQPEINLPSRKSKELNLLNERLQNLFKMLMDFLPEPDRKNAETMVNESTQNPVGKIYNIIQVSPTTVEEKYQVLQCNSYRELLETSVFVLDEAFQRISLQAAIHEKTHRELSQQQKEVFLRMQMKHIKQELGEESDDDDVAELRVRALKKKWDKATAEHFNKELSKLRRLNISNPEYSIQYSYLDNFLNLPWQEYSHKNISLKKVEDILNRDHYGLEKVKDRIIEQMAVIKLRNDLKAPIICLYGPPGTGKTSIGKSIAEALGREYIRISLGGLHDEAEIRGHRRTYIGAMPGRFLQSLSKCKTGNPLVLLDEIDKVGKDFKGDPSSALLEALDPEQNNTFHDNFIDYPYDLSKVLFVATANNLSTIPEPLRDRMEIIELNSYIPLEKREIALRHLVAKSLLDTGLNEGEIEFTPETIDLIIRFYTREAGVRQLEKKIGKILRKIARLKASRKSYPKVITPDIAEEFLGKREVNPDNYENNDFAGVATGLAWTPVGGDILFIETSLSPGKGEKLTLTGNLGDVMKESAVIALQYIKANAAELGINNAIFGKADIHIHVPEGAVPKDGPSAGITLASSMVSAFLGKRLIDKTAMTGEITLRGKVLPVGGIKEKIIAAAQAGLKRIILSEDNRKDIEEISPQYIKGLEFIYVNTLKDVFENALSDELAPNRFEINLE